MPAEILPIQRKTTYNQSINHTPDDRSDNSVSSSNDQGRVYQNCKFDDTQGMSS